MADPTGQVNDVGRYTVYFDPKERSSSNTGITAAPEWTTVLRIDNRWCRHGSLYFYNRDGGADCHVRVYGTLLDNTSDEKTPTEPATTDNSWVDTDELMICPQTKVSPASYSDLISWSADFAWIYAQAQSVDSVSVDCWYRGRS